MPDRVGAHLGQGVVVHAGDGSLLDADATARILLDLPAEGLPAAPHTPADGLALAALRTGRPQQDDAVEVVTPSGSRWLSVTSVPVPDQAARPASLTAPAANAVTDPQQRPRLAPTGWPPPAPAVISTVVDVTESRRRHRHLLRGEEQFRLAMDHTPVAFALVDADTRFLRVNKALCRLFGYHADELRELTLRDLMHPEDAADVAHQLRRLLRGERESIELERRWRKRCGGTMWGLLSVALGADEPGSAPYLIVQIQDVTETRRTHDLLTHLALHDPLTGLPNRTLVLDRIQKALDRGRRTHRNVAVLFCDLDHFKVVNDSAGHDLGDAVLIEVSRRLSGALRAGDTAGRMGGDEFVVVCEDVVDEREAFHVAERIAEAAAEPTKVGNRTVVPTMSIGIAVSSSPDADPLTLLRDADAAMYRAKGQGRNRWDLVDVTLRRRARERLDLELALREGIDADQLRLHFQPIVDVTTGTPVGREALVRWMHPQRGLLAPGEFLHVAEESGLISDVGLWVLDRAVRAAAEAGPDAGYVAVNVSAHQVSRPGLADAVEEVLVRADLPASRLVVELTETVMLSAAPSARKELTRLDDLGVSVVVDDFGTGFSALSYLRDLPVTGIKVDRSFTAGLGHDTQCERIVEAVMGLGRGLGVSVVVEGVETTRQAQMLIDIGCDRAQGYLFGAPVARFC
ncbi:MAG: EAL domain-containing protein [Kineosporiaceae bacterium]